MVHGPCGGVGTDGSCELGDRRCSFVDVPVVPRHPLAGPAGPAGTPRPTDLRDLLRQGRVVVADLPAAALDAGSLTAVGNLLRSTVHAVLAGDSPRSRVQFPPAYRAALVRAAGLRAWTGLTCRDRNRVALEGELAALAHLGVDAVHCVTGDHPALGSRADAAAVFDLDSTQLAELAVGAGLLTSVGESPTAPPTAHRAARLVEKLGTGAEVCFVNHCGGAGPVRVFVEHVHDLGAHPWFLPCVPVVVDVASAALLASFPGLVLPPGHLDRILGARDPREAGIASAVELSEALLAVPGVAGVNLSGGSAPGQELPFAEALAEIGRRLGVDA
ncbi:5,10-methylenetetrahydrofolate reductase [Friedmanniella luteola]|uniref:5,10-methylenetetrahydrofolate reductase n=2 Tax=Friedmanniella luteola TaxID=546871 RepID=A0A1H1ZJ70_9ACTN|nr:5,10-methylenetetrahydrofolate reductase [Friedmanniella luteola]